MVEQRRGNLGLLAVCFTAGILAAGLVPSASVWAWAGLGTLGVVAATIGAARPRWALAALCVAAAALGGARLEARLGRIPRDHLVTRVAEPTLVRVRGSVLTPPVMRVRRGSLARFYHGLPAALFAMRIGTVVMPDGHVISCGGRLMVYVKHAAPSVGPGDRVASPTE